MAKAGCVIALLLGMSGGLALPLLVPSTAQAAETKLPLPRFASLGRDEVNFRTGPGVQFPIDWVYTKKGLPVEILAEFDTWRKVRDFQGAEGWVHQSQLSGRRFALVTAEVRAFRRKPEQGSPMVARVEPGVVGQVLECKDAWCRLEIGGQRGWMLRAELWGVYPDEQIK